MADDAPMVSYGGTVLSSSGLVPIFLCIFTVQVIKYFYLFFIFILFLFLFFVYLAVVIVPVIIQSFYPVPLFPQNSTLLGDLVQFEFQFLLDIYNN